MDRLRLQNHKSTRQRLPVLSVMPEGRRVWRADEVFRGAREARRLMDIATVYRTLRLFRDAEMVIGVRFRDRFHYELVLHDDRHHHTLPVRAS